MSFSADDRVNTLIRLWLYFPSKTLRLMRQVRECRPFSM